MVRMPPEVVYHSIGGDTPNLSTSFSSNNSVSCECEWSFCVHYLATKGACASMLTGNHYRTHSSLRTDASSFGQLSLTPLNCSSGKCLLWMRCLMLIFGLFTLEIGCVRASGVCAPQMSNKMWHEMNLKWNYPRLCLHWCCRWHRTRQTISSSCVVDDLWWMLSHAKHRARFTRKFECMHAFDTAPEWNRIRRARCRCYAKHPPFIIKQSENSIPTKFRGNVNIEHAHPCTEHPSMRAIVKRASAHHNKSVVIFIIHYFSVENACIWWRRLCRSICFLCTYWVALLCFSVQKVGRSSHYALSVVALAFSCFRFFLWTIHSIRNSSLAIWTHTLTHTLLESIFSLLLLFEFNWWQHIHQILIKMRSSAWSWRQYPANTRVQKTFRQVEKQTKLCQKLKCRSSYPRDIIIAPMAAAATNLGKRARDYDATFVENSLANGRQPNSMSQRTFTADTHTEPCGLRMMVGRCQD